MFYSPLFSWNSILSFVGQRGMLSMLIRYRDIRFQGRNETLLFQPFEHKFAGSYDKGSTIPMVLFADGFHLGIKILRTMKED